MCFIDTIEYEGKIHVEVSAVKAKIVCYEKSDPDHAYVSRAVISCVPYDASTRDTHSNPGAVSQPQIEWFTYLLSN